MVIKANFFQRVISSVILLALLLPALLINKGQPMVAIFIIIAICGSYESLKLVKNKWLKLGFLLAIFLLFSYPFLSIVPIFFLPIIFYPQKLNATKDLATILITASFAYVMLCQAWLVNSSGVIIYISLQFIASVADSMGYVCGKLFNSSALGLPASPKKTLTGFIGALLLTPILYSFLLKFLPLIDFPIWTLSLLSLASICSDLLFSAIKRMHQIKDYSQLIPGHGGILDRVDSLYGVSWVYLLILPL